MGAKGSSGPTHTEPHQVYRIVVDEFLCSYAGDLVHKALLVREEAMELLGEEAAGRDAGLVAIVQIPHHCDSGVEWRDRASEEHNATQK